MDSTAVSVLAPWPSLRLAAAAIGVALYVGGSIGQHRAHCILASLRDGARTSGTSADRNKSTASSYSIPFGSLFAYVSMPHYFCEMVEYTGLWLISGFKLSQLSVRSCAYAWAVALLACARHSDLSPSRSAAACCPSQPDLPVGVLESVDHRRSLSSLVPPALSELSAPSQSGHTGNTVRQTPRWTTATRSVSGVAGLHRLLRSRALGIEPHGFNMEASTRSNPEGGATAATRRNQAHAIRRNTRERTRTHGAIVGQISDDSSRSARFRSTRPHHAPDAAWTAARLQSPRARDRPRTHARSRRLGDHSNEVEINF